MKETAFGGTKMVPFSKLGLYLHIVLYVNLRIHQNMLFNSDTITHTPDKSMNHPHATCQCLQMF